MAESTRAALPATLLPKSADIERAEQFTREPFVHDGEDARGGARPRLGAPARARRRARRDRRRRASDPVGRVAARLLAAARPRARCSPRTSRTLADGTRALRPPGRRALGHADRAARRGPGNGNGPRQRPAPPPSSPRSWRRSGSPARTTTTRTTTSPRSRSTGTTTRRSSTPTSRSLDAARGPQRRQALLVRARHRRRQDRRRAGLRRGLAHRRRPDPHPPPQPRRPVPRRAARPRLPRSASRPALLGGQDRADGPVTVETYQWFVRNAGNVSDAYTIVICDEAHTALGEKTSAAIRRWDGPIFIGMTATGALIARHVTDLFPTQTSRFDLAQAARRGVIAPLRCVRIPPGPGRAHDRQGAAAQGRGRRRVRPGAAGRAAGPAAVQPGDRRPLQDALQRRARRRLRRRRAPRLQRRRGVPRRSA